MSLDTFSAGFAVAAVIVGLTAALLHERAMRHALTDRVKQLEKLLRNLERVGRNKLYREALEDIGFGAAQAALHIQAAENSLAVAKRIMNPNLLDPEPKDKP